MLTRQKPGALCGQNGPAGHERWGCCWVQEKRIRAQQSMKQLSKRMAEQRLKTLEHLRKGMTPKGKVRPHASVDLHRT